jgi:hypothetical protein
MLLKKFQLDTLNPSVVNPVECNFKKYKIRGQNGLKLINFSLHKNNIEI